MIPPELITGVRQLLEAQPLEPAQIVPQLRAAFPGVMFSVCNDNDIPSRIRAIGEGEGFMLYGVNTGGHCASLISDPEAADGLAVALIDGDD